MSIESEQAVLGCLLNENELFHLVADTLKPEHFSDGIHAMIYSDIARLISQSRKADAITLKERYDSMPQMSELGGALYLVDLMREAPTNDTCRAYSQAVIDSSTRNQLQGYACEVREISNSGDNSRDMLEECEKRLFNIAESEGASQGFTSLASPVDSALSLAEKAFELGKNPNSVSTSFGSLDKKLGGIGQSDLVIIAGRPSMGKTTLATNMAFGMAKKGIPTGFFSLEMSSEQLAMRVISEESGVSSSALRNGEATRAQMARARDAAAYVRDLPVYVDPTGGILIPSLMARARRMKRLHGIEAIFVDYIQLVAGTTNEGRVQEVSQVTKCLKEVAKELNIPVVALSQLSRAVEQRENKRPQLSDLRESGSIEQDADSVMFVYRDAYYLEREEPAPCTPEWQEWNTEFMLAKSKAEIIVGKNRHGEIGTVELGFDANTTKFYDRESAST